MSKKTSKKLSPILLAEDQPDDIFFMRSALEKAGIPNPLHVVRDGQEAIDYLEGEGQFANRDVYPLPRLLLLDLKMPRLDGFDVLDWLASCPELNDLAVVILSSSAMEPDRSRARRMGADDYLTKPSAIDELVKLVQDLHVRWISEAQETSAGS